jgi:hypothetical protein
MWHGGVGQGKSHPVQSVISMDEELVLVEFRKQLLDGWLFDSDERHHPNEARLCDSHVHVKEIINIGGGRTNCGGEKKTCAKYCCWTVSLPARY